MPDQIAAHTIEKGISNVGCQKRDLLDIGGVACTGADGNVEFNLSKVWCPGGRRSSFEAPANVLATPRSETPVLLTARTSQADPEDVTIAVMSWYPDGSAAPNVEFDWRCRVPRAVVRGGGKGGGPKERGGG